MFGYGCEFVVYSAPSTGNTCVFCLRATDVTQYATEASFSLLGTQHGRAHRLDDLEAVVAGSLCEQYQAELQPYCSILVVPEDCSKAMYTRPDI